MGLPEKMRAVVLKGDYSVSVEDRPTPKLLKPEDAVLKVSAAGLCGSDLHYYRGHLKCPPGFICGHEFVGEIVEKGPGVTKFKVGDRVVVPFYTTCQECFYCKRGQASRIPKGQLFGNSVPANTIDGGQAEYVRVPLAQTTLVAVPEGIPEEMLVLMSDIFPTGYYCASRYLKDLSPEDKKTTVAVAVGCGPVGICGITAALTMVDTVYAIDSVPERLAEAEKIGAKTILLDDNPVEKIKAATDGRGADVVMEFVGHGDALQLAIDLIRPFGQISCVGVHTEMLNLNGLILYGKNATMSFGRCPVASIFNDALKVLLKEQDKVKFLCGRFMSLEDAPEAFRIFEQRKVSAASQCVTNCCC